MSDDRYDLWYDPNSVGGDLVVECWISHGPRAGDARFDPQPGDWVRVGDDEEAPLRARVNRRDGNRVWVHIERDVTSQEDPFFAQWVVDVTDPEGYGFLNSLTGRFEQIPPKTLRWCRGVYDNDPTLTVAAGVEKLGAHRVRNARLAFGSIGRDIRNATERDPDLSADVHAGVEVMVRFFGAWGYLGEELDDLANAVAAVAGLVQEYVMEDMGDHWNVWPLCSTHDVGSHPEVHQDRAEWRCHVGDHAVAAVGELHLVAE